MGSLQSDRFDVSKVALTGFSAGAALALSTGNFYGSEKIQPSPPYYPPVNFESVPAESPVPHKARSGIHLSPGTVGLFNSSYVPDLTTRKDPRFRIGGLETSRFPTVSLSPLATSMCSIPPPNRTLKNWLRRRRARRSPSCLYNTKSMLGTRTHWWPESVESRDDTYSKMISNLKEAFQG